MNATFHCVCDFRQVAKASTGGKKSGTCWADSDTESDAEQAAPPEKKRDPFGDSESESESESEAEDGEGDSEVCNTLPIGYFDYATY